MKGTRTCGAQRWGMFILKGKKKKVLLNRREENSCSEEIGGHMKLGKEQIQT